MVKFHKSNQNGDSIKPIKKSLKKLPKTKQLEKDKKLSKKKLSKHQENEENGVHEDTEDVITFENGDGVVDEVVDNTSDHNSVDEEEEEKTSSKPANHIIKVLEPKLTIEPIYTGGKVQLTNNDKNIYSLCNNEIVVYSLEENKIIRKITQENEEIGSFVVHPTEESIVYFTKNFLLRHVSLVDNSVIRIWKILKHTVLDMAIDKTGRLLAVGSANGFIQVFDLKKGNKTHTFQNNKGPIIRVDFHPQPNKLFLFSLSEDYTLKFYDLIVNTCAKVFSNFESVPQNFAVLDDGIHLMTSSLDSKINVYDIQKTAYLTQFEAYDEIAGIESIKAIEPKTKENKRFLVFGGKNGVLKTIDLTVEGAQTIDHVYINFESIMRIIKFSHSNKLLVISSEQNFTILSYSMNNKGELWFYLDHQFPGFNDEITDVKFIKNKDQNMDDYIVYSTNSSQIRVFFPDTGNTKFLWGHSDIVMALDTYGPYIASSSKDNLIKIWQYNGSDFALLGTLSGHNKSVGTIHFAPLKGNVLVSGSADQNVKLWDIQQFKEISPEEPIEVSSAKYTVVGHQKDINCVRFSPNEKLIASGSQDKTINIYDPHGLKVRMALRGHKRGVWDIAFSPVEKVLASVSGDATLRLWNLNDGSCIQTFEGHLASVLKVSWISYGLEIVTTGADGLIKVWNVKKMICINTFEKHQGKVWSLDSRLDTKSGKYQVLTGGNDSMLFFWEDRTLETDKQKKEEENQKNLQQQQLFNLMRENKLMDAGKLSFDLNMTKRFINVMEKIFYGHEFRTNLILLDDDENEAQDSLEKSEEYKKTFKELVEYCIGKDFKRTLTIIRDLNTSNRYSRIAQEMLQFVLEGIDFENLDEIKKNFQKGSEEISFNDMLEALLSYSERHFARIKKYVKKSFYVDYILKQSFLFTNTQQ